jgi:hypothetical protein
MVTGTRTRKGVHEMKNLTLLCFVCAALGALALPAGAEPYWVAYEGNDLPENEGWNRYWGNADGEYQGPGAYRTVEDGILTMDSLYDLEVYDFVEITLPGLIDPDPGETFIAEWRLKVEQVDGRVDPSIGIFSDTAMVLGFEFDEDSLISVFEDFRETPITPGVFHEYHLVTHDMQLYELYIDGALAIEGAFSQNLGLSTVGWGDGCHPAASRTQWDYFRFGVVPEPSTLFLFLGICAATLRRATRIQDCRSTTNKKEL